jgi:FkbM family methyltransferase
MPDRVRLGDIGEDMTADADHAATRAAVAHKHSELLSRDLAMQATAVKYDLDLKADRTRSTRQLVRLFFNLVKHLDIDLFVEAGAKEASSSRRAHTLLKDVRVVAFEANPYTYRKFADANDGAGIEYLNLALTDTPGPVTFHVLRDDDGLPRADGQSSILKRNRGRDAERGFEEVTVEGVRLDDFFAGQKFESAAIWMDVEGACKFVLGGASDLLSKTAVLIIEVEDRPFWGDDHWLRERVVSHLYDVGLVPVARDFEYEHQYNIVFVRESLLRSSPWLRLTLTRFTSMADGARKIPESSSLPRPQALHPRNRMSEIVRRSRAGIKRRLRAQG